MSTTCPCDELGFPTEPSIAAGHESLARQLGSFPQFRLSMLEHLRSVDVQGTTPLSAWRARDGEDLGVMLVEMAAYVLDSLAFYDERIANEIYLATAQRRESARELVELLSFRLKQGVGSSSVLYGLVTGDAPVDIPRGQQFRSESFAEELPHVFEAIAQGQVSAETNVWDFEPVRSAFTWPGTAPLGSPQPGNDPSSKAIDRSTGQVIEDSTVVLLKAESAAVTQGDVVHFFRSEDGLTVRAAAVALDVAPFTGADGEDYFKLAVAPELPNQLLGVLAENVRIDLPTQSASLTRNQAEVGEGSLVFSNGQVRAYLDSAYNSILPSDVLVFEYRGVHTAALVSRVDVVETGLVLDGEPVKVPVTRVWINNPPPDLEAWAKLIENFPGEVEYAIKVHFNMISGGQITTVARTDIPASAIKSGSGLALRGLHRAPNPTPKEFVLEGADGKGAHVTGELTFDKSGEARFKLDDNQDFPPLRAPIKLYGNLIKVTRGESTFEALGSGDAREKFQTFKLSRKPLTYLDAPTSNGTFQSTLEVRVDGVLWEEVESFFGRGPDDQVYIVRHDDEQETFITFGDGINGARVPTGERNIMAHYRFGAGAAVPPAGTINQVAMPIRGLDIVNNVLPAAGGADPEDPASLKTSAPRSALLLGRAVSVQDFEAAALSAVSGVIAATAHWGWCEDSARAAVKVHYIGTQTEEAVLAALTSVADPTTPIQVAKAEGLDTELTADITVDGAYVPDAVAQQVHAALFDPDHGPLAKRNVGIGRAVFRSRLFDVILSVPGVVSVESITMTVAGQDPVSFSECAGKSPGEGHYFNFADSVEQSVISATALPDAEHRCGL